MPGGNMERRYECLRPSQIISARNAFPLAFIPLGTLEWHGPQNPVGLDGLKAHALCVRAAEEAGGVVFPTVWYGEHRESHLMEINASVGKEIAGRMELPSENFKPGYTQSGTIIEQAQDYVSLLWKISCQAKSLGFKAIIFFNGHYPLSHYGRFVGHLVVRHLGMPNWAGHEGQILDEYGDPGHGDHGGKWETSLLMALVPDAVELQDLRDAGEFVGCGKNAIDSTVAEGEAWAGKIAAALARKGRELLSG
jgi:creatinine amidohydrolase